LTRWDRSNPLDFQESKLILLAGEDEGFKPPGVADFNLPPIFGDNPYTTKPIFLAFLSVILISVFFVAASRKALIMPNKLQFAGESVYGFVRNNLGQEIIGREFMRFVPYLFTLFTFILTNNVFGIVPFLQFPTMSRVSFAYVLAMLTFFVFHYVGIKHKGLLPYLKEIMFPPGVPKPIYIVLTPIEISTYLLVRPLTLSLKLVAPFAFAFGIALTFFEFMVQCLQAYIFTLLTAMFIAGALADEH
jgi:F-type H+-transporting ATPase subunit a